MHFLAEVLDCADPWMYLVITQKTYHKRLLSSVDFLVKKALTEGCGYGH